MQYDGAVYIKTDIDTKKANVQLASLENRMVKTADNIASLRSKMDILKDTKVPTQEYAALESELSKLGAEYDKIAEKQQKFLSTGGKEGASTYKRFEYDLDRLDERQDKVLAKMKRLEESGKAFTLGSDTEQYSNLSRQLQYAENELSVLNQKHNILISKQRQTESGYKKLGNTAKKSLEKASKSAEKAAKSLSGIGMSFKNILKYGFGIRSLYVLINKLRSAIKDGFANLLNYNSMLENSVNELKASALTLKNAFAAAFSPLVEIALPYIKRVIDMLTMAVDLAGQFMAAITGQRTYTRAIKQTTAAIKENNKESNKQLSSLDKLNNLTSSKGDDDTGASTMFEEVPINSKILDFIDKLKKLLQPVIDYAKKLKDIFMQGFWDGLGDWQYRWESIKDSIASIKDSLIDIFTDPAVLEAADRWAQSVAYMLGSLVGSLASIGLTIAANLLGGIAKYLEQNKERIKQYLISMFDIWAEVNYLFADLFQSIAYVFEAFASEQGQQLTANIIGIFADAFMGITELASKLFRDIATIIIKPFVDNKEAFRTALEGFLGVLATVTGTIKQGIDDTFDKLNEVYDTHFKPFFDSVAQGLSDLIAKFLEFWNGNVQPILDQWAADFDELWTSHIQPLLDNAAEFLGKVADLLKVLWENYLQPFIAWFIENILPTILPVIQTIWDMIVDFVSIVSDVISSIITILGGIIDFLTGVFSGDWELAFQGLSEIVNGFVDLVTGVVEGFFTLIGDLLNTFIEFIKSGIDAFVQTIEDIIDACLNWIQENIVDKFEEIKKNFHDFIENVKEKWKSGWEELKENVGSIVEGIKETIKSAFGWITDKIDSLKEKLGSIKSKAGSILSSFKGGSTYSISASGVQIPVSPVVAALSNVEIPAYATGQVIPRTMKQHLAILGDNSQETEVVSPISTMKQAMIEALVESGFGGMGGDINLHITAEVEGYQFLNIIQKIDRQFFKQNGRHII